MTDYSNTQSDIVSAGGGTVRVTVGTSSTKANSGTALPCRECYVSRITVDPAVSVRMSIDADPTMLNGFPLPNVTAGIPHPMRIPIDDLNKLRFIASAATTVLVMYRR